MAIVVLKCDVCKRDIQLQRNEQGIETPSHCIITHGCRGQLYQVDLLEDFVRGVLPEDVPGLENWQQRNVLHNHQQAIERDEWIIIHNLGTFPSLSVFVDRPTSEDPDNRIEITPQDVIIVNPDVIRLIFDRPWSGIAQLVARQSDPLLLQPFVREADPVVVPRQLSNSGELTIATRINTIGQGTNVNFEITYKTSIDTEPAIVYSADDVPSTLSAWSDFDKIVVKGKVYTVRSFQALVTEHASGVINSGSTFQFTGVDPELDAEFRPVAQGEVLLLLAKPPFTLFDKITTDFIDVFDVSPTLNPFGMFFDSGEFFALPEVSQTVFPPIREV